MRKQWMSALILLSLGTALLFTTVPASTLFDFPDNINIGPYVDQIVYKVMANQDQKLLALLAGEIEFDTSFFNPVHFMTLAADPDIDIFTATENGYGEIIINCEKYPLNISGLRRAFAYAFNKSQVVQSWLNGLGQVHDSIVPYTNEWCVEDSFSWHYYNAEPEIGNAILDNLNFSIDSGTGYRLAPDGTPFDIVFEIPTTTYEYPALPHTTVEALESLHINASFQLIDYNDTLTKLDNHGDYDMAYYHRNFQDYDVVWLADRFWSDYADIEYQNPSNFRNDTFDSWRNQLLHGIYYEEVYEASEEMQKILHYNVPSLVVSMRTYMQGYRNDVFTGHVEDLGKYISGPWTLRKIHKLDGTFGGTVSIAISEEPDSFNIYNTTSYYSEMILSELWPSLFRLSPALTPWPDLVEQLITQTHSENASVPEGHIRYIMDIIQNAKWSDGIPLTAHDVAFTFDYIIARGVYGSFYRAPNYIETESDYRVILEYDSESYWHFNDFAFERIIPEHVFNYETGIGILEWYDWNPVFNATHPHVTCGPFNFREYEPGEFYRLTFNSIFYYEPHANPPPPPPPPPPPGNSTNNWWDNIPWAYVSLIIEYSTFTVIVVSAILISYKVRKRNDF